MNEISLTVLDMRPGVIAGQGTRLERWGVLWCATEVVVVSLRPLDEWSFMSTHKHGNGEVVQITHFGCNLYVDSHP